MAPLTGDYYSMTLGCYKSPPLQEISSRDLSGEVKSNFGRNDPYRVNYLVNNSGNEAEVSLELKLNKTPRAKYEGTMRSFNGQAIIRYLIKR